MLYRIITGIAALFVGTLAIGLPIMLTEAGTTTTTSNSRTLNASFEYVDPGTGDQYYATIYASLDAYTQNTSDNGGGGSGGSGRANSGRPNGGGNSQRPGGGGGGGQVFVSNRLNVYVDRYSASGDRYGDGYTNTGTIVIASDLSSGSVRATVPFSVYTNGAGYEQTSVEIDLSFSATGPLVTTRERYSSHVKSPRQSYSNMSTMSRRQSQATGRFDVGAVVTGGPNLNLAGGGSYYAEIATYDSKSRSSY